MFLSAAVAGQNTDNSALRADILAAHNRVRQSVGVPPLAWSEHLAGVAQQWANQLLATNGFRHSGGPYGENLFEIMGGAATPDHVVNDWAAEASGYDYKRNSCSGRCGHYTQLVWRKTKSVGCAVARNGQREMWVCEYDPPGNFVGERPY